MSLNNMSYKFNDDKTNSMIFMKEKISGTIMEKEINKNLFLLKTNITSQDDTLSDSSVTIDGMVLSFNLKGQSDFKSNISNLNIKTSNNITNIILSKDENSKTSIKKGEISIIDIILKKDFLAQNIPNGRIKDKLLNSLQKDICNELLSHKTTNYQTQLLLNDINNSPFDGVLNDMFVQSKVLELVYLEFKELFINQNSFLDTKKLKLSIQDIESIKKAKEILIQNMQNPPSIMQLAKMVAINDFKLKSGFKIVFGTTPHNLLIDYRLTLARTLLLDADMNINEISQHIGYKFTANFSTAFSKKFKVLPKDLMKSRKYY
ncbi:AraC family transcriptional regulator [Sulfurimonas sp.]|uniref:AraC family transcriptional regulator n=1 Tax=Sulfurimonas sp. TaxID=2022749 RepID=UPI002B4A8029|nr:AraC family transcriptional regulator [Sulfurimonas sp.]